MPASTTENKRHTPKKTPQITSAQAWSQGQADGVVTELPSGKIVMLVRKLDLPVMLRSGRIPNPLAGVIRKMINGGQEKPGLPEEMSQDPVVFEQMMDMVDNAVAAAMVEPKAIVPPTKGKHPSTAIGFSETDEAFQKRWNDYEDVLADVEANTISTDWVSLEDKIFIFFFSQGGAADLATFRTATGNAMAALSGI